MTSFGNRTGLYYDRLLENKFKCKMRMFSNNIILSLIQIEICGIAQVSADWAESSDMKYPKSCHGMK